MTKHYAIAPYLFSTIKYETTTWEDLKDFLTHSSWKLEWFQISFYSNSIEYFNGEGDLVVTHVIGRLSFHFCNYWKFLE